MALPHTFANVTELDTPQLDDNFNAVGALTVIPCVASGTNAITLTPAANTPTISAYTNNAPEFSFEAASTSTGALTLQVLGLGLKNVYKNNGATAAGANDFIAGSTYKVAYNGALNGAAGGWVILNQGASSASAGSVQGVFKNLKVQMTSDTAIAITADQIACSDGSTSFTTVFAASLTMQRGTVGANGIDTGSISSITWYYVLCHLQHEHEHSGGFDVAEFDGADFAGRLLCNLLASARISPMARRISCAHCNMGARRNIHVGTNPATPP